MEQFELTSELKSILLFSGAGTAMGGISSMIGMASFALPIGIAALIGLKKGVEKIFIKESSWVMANGAMPYLTFWYMIWVLAINV